MNCSIRRMFVAAGRCAARFVGPKETAFGRIPRKNSPRGRWPKKSTRSNPSRPQRKSSSKGTSKAFFWRIKIAAGTCFLHWIPNSE